MTRLRVVAEDFTYLPVFIAYQYFFAVLKLYAAFTLNNTAWGTRDANAFKSPEQIAAEAAAAAGGKAGKGDAKGHTAEQGALLAHRSTLQSQSLPDAVPEGRSGRQSIHVHAGGRAQLVQAGAAERTPLPVCMEPGEMVA
jgi:hypothetical protein